MRIENFQSHEDTEFDLSPGINLIVGSSEGGKSAILRAINFALHNEPRGDDFIRMDTDETRVHIWWNDGCYLCRIKGSSRNAVLIKDKDGFEQGFEKIGLKGLPHEALEVLGFPPIDSETGPISYADQHQPLFLVTLTASELPRTISRLTGIDDFEDAAELLNKDANAANKTIKESNTRLNKINNDLLIYNNLDNQLNHLDTMEILAVNIDEVIQANNNAKVLHTAYQDLMINGKNTKKALDSANLIAELNQYIPEIKQIVNNINNANLLRSSFQTLLNLENQSIDTLAISENICKQTNKTLLDDVKTKINHIIDAKKLHNTYLQIMNQGTTINNELKKHQNHMDALTTEYQTLIQEMKTSGAWCDICQRPKSMDVCND